MAEYTSIDIGSKDQQQHKSNVAERIEDSSDVEHFSDSVAFFSLDNIGLLESWSCSWVRAFYCRSKRAISETKSDDTKHTKMPKLNLHHSDKCRANVDALQNLFRIEEEQKGKVNTSMIRICLALCRRRILLGSGVYLLASALGVLAITVFLRLIFHIAFSEAEEYNKARMGIFDNDTETIGADADDSSMNIVVKHVYTVGFVVLILMMYTMRCICSSINLRTAIMLRNACVGAVFDSSIKTPIQKNFASFQVMTFCAEDGDAIMEFVQKGSVIVAQIIAVVLCVISSSFILGVSICVSLIGLFFVFLVGYMLAIWSSRFYRKSQYFLFQKLMVTDEFCRHSNEVFDNRDIYKNRFSAAVSGQFWALFRAESLRPAFSGCVTAMVLLAIITISHMISVGVAVGRYSPAAADIMSVVFLFIYLMYILVSESSDAISALVKGMVVLDKVKSYLGSHDTLNVEQEPADASFVISLRDASFKWETRPKMTLDKENELGRIEKPEFVLQIPNLQIKRNAIVGIVSDDVWGVFGFVHALLGNMPQAEGIFHRRSPIVYFPENPFLLERSSVRKQILFNDETPTNELLYQEALATVQLRGNPNFDVVLLEKHEMDLQYQQKISLVRALYDQRLNTIILENPLSSIDSNNIISDIFAEVCSKLYQQGKTVIVVSQNDYILRHCQIIHLLENGQLGQSGSCEEIKNSASYNDITRTYQNNRLHNRVNTATNLQTDLNTSTDDLVEIEAKPVERKPTIFNPLDTFYLVLLSLLNVFFQMGLPIIDFLGIVMIPFFFGVYIVLIGALLVFLFLVGSNLLVKHYVHRNGRRYTKRVHRDIFEHLLNTSLNGTSESYIVHHLNALMESNFKAFQLRATSIYSWMVVVSTAWGFVVMEMFWSFPLILMLLQFVALFYGFRQTVTNVGLVQQKSRIELFENVHNEINGRAVIQSYGHIENSRNRIFELIDANSSTIYLGKSVVYFTQLLFTLCQTINLPTLMIAVHQNNETYYSYPFSLYIFFLLTYHIYALLEMRLEKILADQKLVDALRIKTIKNIG